MAELFFSQALSSVPLTWISRLSRLIARYFDLSIGIDRRDDMSCQVLRIRDMLSLKYSELVYNGFWSSPLLPSLIPPP